MKERIKQGLECPYCGKDSECIDSAAIYRRSFGYLYICYDCNAYVGCHSDTRNALGRLANEELREWKKRAHNAFDPLWKKGVFAGRSDAYAWLSDVLGIDPDETHIGMFDVFECQRVVRICTPLLPKG